MGGAARVLMNSEPEQYSEPGVRAHCMRVAALADYAAELLNLSPALRGVLRDACCLHHAPATLLNERALQHLLSDLGGATRNPSRVAPATAGVLRLWNAAGGPVHRTAENLQLAAILDAANALDEAFESLPYDGRSVSAVIDECLAETMSKDLAEVFGKLRMLSDEGLTKSVAASKLEAHPSVHARDVAMRSRQIAEKYCAAPAFAQRAGRLHDCGIGVADQFDESLRTALTRWQQAGFPRVYCERLLTGSDHGEWGAMLLERALHVEPEVIEAVRCHHRPEISKSTLAALLYLAEEETGGEEDLPSAARVHLATRLLTTASAPPSSS
jgi:HD superfamily phosphohydrolase YqeK